jgi:hypothetical protein
MRVLPPMLLHALHLEPVDDNVRAEVERELRGAVGP